MPRQDSLDFFTAFAVGTVLGIGATLLLQPERTPRERVSRTLKPYRKRMRRSYEEVARGVRGGSEATSEFTSEVMRAGRELLGEFRTEVAQIVDEARGELTTLAREQLRDFNRGRSSRRGRV